MSVLIERNAAVTECFFASFVIDLEKTTVRKFRRKQIKMIFGKELH